MERPATSRRSGNRIPRPGSPFMDALAGHYPRPVRAHSVPDCVDLDQVLRGVCRIAVWVPAEGRLEVHGRFLLQDLDSDWHALPFGDPRTATLVERVRGLPGFDMDLVLDRLAARTARIEIVWPTRDAVSAGSGPAGLQPGRCPE